MDQTRNEHNEVLLHAVESAMKEMQPITKDPFAIIKAVMGLAPVAVHWMITLHITLLILASLAGPDARSPSLMALLLLSYIMAFFLWPVKNAIEKLCCKTLGFMIFTGALFLVVYACRDFLSIGMNNIFRWTGEALFELIDLFK